MFEICDKDYVYRCDKKNVGSVNYSSQNSCNNLTAGKQRQRKTTSTSLWGFSLFAKKKREREPEPLKCQGLFFG